MKLSDLMVLPSPLNTSDDKALPLLLPLRWKGTRHQWWYASPVDLASALGHFDVVRQLLSFDPNNLIDLTSLRRIHRLDSLWLSYDNDRCSIAKSRSIIARELLLELDSTAERASMSNVNPVVSSGHGGWLMYTVAAAGDAGFVAELLDRNPLLVFGEGEYGLTDIMYAGAKSRCDGLFRLLLDFAISPRFCVGEPGEGFEERIGEAPAMYKREIRNRAVHAAARGGNSVILKELLAECNDLLDLRDVRGSTILHSAAGKGQEKVVEDLIQLYPDILFDARDRYGNTALHVAAYKGQTSTIELLISKHPMAASMRNDGGDTLLHKAISGMCGPGFRELNSGIKLLEKLCGGGVVDIKGMINIRNDEGRTPLHLAVSGNLHPRFVEILTSVPGIDVNIPPGGKGTTAMDPLRGMRRRGLAETGDVGEVEGRTKEEGGSSPGTAFDVPDSNIFRYANMRNGGGGGGSTASEGRE